MASSIASTFLPNSTLLICCTWLSENLALPAALGVDDDVLPTACAADLDLVLEVPLSALYKSIAREAAQASVLFLYKASWI